MNTDNKTYPVKVGNVVIGGGNNISIQSMTNTSTSNAEETLQQILQLFRSGCDLIRVAFTTNEEANSFEKITSKSPIPVIADIHFNYKLALEAIERGAAKIRINPGNIGSREKLKEVVDKAGSNKIPIRIGVNSGSIEKNILKKYGGPTSNALVESALNNVNIIQGMGFKDLVVSLKASDVATTIKAYREFSQNSNLPLHLGVTEAGTFLSGTIKNSIGIGSLLADGIGDTLRVSLTAPPVEEIKVGKKILQSLGLRSGINVISCPTCARTAIDVKSLADRVEEELSAQEKDLTVAVMGCSVNGPGEASEADLGIAGGKNFVAVFKHGRIIKKVKREDSLQAILDEIE